MVSEAPNIQGLARRRILAGTAGGVVAGAVSVIVGA
jgi:hypothetical protein